jgi:hypothetical protein
MTARRLAAALAISLALSACAPLQAPRCANGASSAVDDTLYFGTATPAGVVVADDWARFLDSVVTPRFPQGLSVSQAAGQWRGADGATVRESTHVLRLVHPDDAASERATTEIVADYKARFRQEAVLRVRSSTCVSF